MSDFEPRFEARPVGPLGEGWCVHIFWPSGKTDVIPGFSNQYHALGWIKSSSANWLADKIINDPDY
jgi:hypothetical protein